MSNNFLSMLSHTNIDTLINNRLVDHYKNNQLLIEHEQARKLLNDTPYYYNNHLENMLLINYIIRKICATSNNILNEDNDVSVYDDFRNKLCLEFFNFSFNKLESAIIEIIIIHLDELLEEKQYLYYEELDAVDQHFKSFANIYGIDQTRLYQLVEDSIQNYQQSIVGNLLHCIKRGKNAFLSLKKINIVDTNLLLKIINKTFSNIVPNT